MGDAAKEVRGKKWTNYIPALLAFSLHSVLPLLLIVQFDCLAFLSWRSMCFDF